MARLLTIFIFLSLLFINCNERYGVSLFSLLPSAKTGITFINHNVDTDKLNILDYLYYYNGGGVSVGDINNDGLPDIYFVANTGENKLYLNKGNLSFQDITTSAAVQGNAGWKTGSTMADVNGDGYLDIYVCAAGNLGSPAEGRGPFFTNSSNQLFINNRDNTFTESSALWGLDICGYNTQSVFFDYDNDGDLDMFLLQHSVRETSRYPHASERNNYDSTSGGKLFRNEGKWFTDVTKDAGIYSSSIGYGLGVAVADLNHDGYPDIYVSNDFYENDYYYLNLGNGRFREINQDAFAHESKFSMGTDIGDLNGDGWPDIVTLDMLPGDEKVLKSSQGYESPDEFNNKIRLGYTPQYSRNTVQLNTGEGLYFSDIALYSGVAATDWSWSPLIADFDLDGLQDLFVSNGIKKRQNDLDYIKFLFFDVSARRTNLESYDRELLSRQPDGHVNNYFFKGGHDMKFTDMSADWGMNKPTLSHGAAFADLDNDGDLDLVTNNMNSEAGIYENHARQQKAGSHYLKLQLKQPGPNVFAIGARVFLFFGGKLAYKEVQMVHGFLSSSEPSLHFGLGQNAFADSVLIIWPDNTCQRLINPGADRTLTINYHDNPTEPIINPHDFIRSVLHSPNDQHFLDITHETKINFVHKEDSLFSDFNQQPFIPHKTSANGPHVAVADINLDGLEDFFICGSERQHGSVYLQQANGSFTDSEDPVFFPAAGDCHGTDAIFTDVNGDLYMDLIVLCSSNCSMESSCATRAHLYTNKGNGYFSLGNFPEIQGNYSVACAADFDGDGDPDIFIGGRSDPLIYGVIPRSWLLQNDGKGNFSDVTSKVLPDIEHIGMVTDACWVDPDKNGHADLLIVGEWMMPVLFKNHGGSFQRQMLTTDDNRLKGWWQTVKSADVNGDGYDDLLLGNYGLNSKLKATDGHPLKMYLGDIADNGHNTQVLAVAKDDKYYPFLDKESLEARLPWLKKQFLTYAEMAGKTVTEIFGDRLSESSIFTATTLESVLLINDKKGGFRQAPAPASLQWTALSCFAVGDFTKDGLTDFVTGGNFYGTLPYEGRYDAMPLCLYEGTGSGRFKAIFPLPAEFRNRKGEITSIEPITLSGTRKCLLVVFNNGALQILEII